MEKKLIKVCLAAQAAGVQFRLIGRIHNNWCFNNPCAYTIDKENYALLLDFIAGSQDFNYGDVDRVRKYFGPVPKAPIVEPLITFKLDTTGHGPVRAYLSATEIRAMQRGMRGLHGELQSPLAKAILGYAV